MTVDLTINLAVDVSVHVRPEQDVTIHRRLEGDVSDYVIATVGKDETVAQNSIPDGHTLTINCKYGLGVQVLRRPDSESRVELLLNHGAVLVAS